MTILFRICKKTHDGELSIAIHNGFNSADLWDVGEGRRMQRAVGRTENFNCNALAGNPREKTGIRLRIANAMNMITAQTGGDATG